MFLAGDACHLHPPFGGYGMNMGIGDAVDLGWKLAAVIQGWGGSRLLDSYEPERRPIHKRVVDEAIENLSFFANYVEAGNLEDATPAGVSARVAMASELLAVKTREFRGLGVMLGYSYSGSPIVVPDGSAAPAEHPIDYVPSAHPGSRAPHVWLEPGLSLFDRFGPGFTLLATDGDAHGADIGAFVDAARGRALPLTVVAPRHAELRRLYGARLALIRPDQHVAWRGDACHGRSAEILDIARGVGAAAPRSASTRPNTR